MKFAFLAALCSVAATSALAQVNAGTQAAEASVPFVMTQVASFNLPWRIAFLPDGRMLVTEKVGPVWLVTQQGAKTPVSNVPKVLAEGQGGMLGVFLSPHYARDHFVYLTYAEPSPSRQITFRPSRLAGALPSVRVARARARLEPPCGEGSA